MILNSPLQCAAVTAAATRTTNVHWPANRLARALAETGDLNKAQKCSQKVLKIDPINSIAGKALKKWKDFKPGDVSINTNCHYAEAFLEEPGKTKIATLMYLGDPTHLSQLDSGEIVNLDCHCHRIAVTTTQGVYIGRLPDDLSAKLRKLVSCGNKYEASLISIEPEKAVKIFIREVARGKGTKILTF